MILFIFFLALLGCWSCTLRREYPHRTAKSSPQVRLNVLYSLEIGDIVQNGLRDWVVESIYIYNQDDFEWVEYLLRDLKILFG